MVLLLVTCKMRLKALLHMLGLLTLLSDFVFPFVLGENFPQVTPANSLRYFLCPSDSSACNDCYTSKDGAFSLQCSAGAVFDIFNVEFSNKPNDSRLNVNCPSSQDLNFFQFLVKGPQTASIATVTLNNCPVPFEDFKSFLGKWMDPEAIQELSLDFQPPTTTLAADKFNELWNITKLSINQNNISSLPPLIFQDLVSLTHLRLDDNRLTNLTQAHFKNLKSLRLLQLGSNEIANIEEDTFRDLAALRQLNLEQNSLQDLPRKLLYGLTSLIVLDLSKNRISNLDENQFSKNTQLKVLHLRENNLTSLSGGIFANNQHLKVLQLHLNPHLSTIQKGAFKNLRLLEELDLSNCALIDFDDDAFSSLENLKSLDLSQNHLTMIKLSWFAGLTKLESLDLSNNQLIVIEPGMFIGLRSLETLTIDNNKLVNLTAGAFEGLTSLETLSLQDNELSLIEEQSLEPLSALRKIYLGGNQLSFSERSIHPSEPWRQSPLLFNRNLETIDLSRNKINELFSDWMLLFPQLSKLNLAENQFEVLTLNELTGFGLSTPFELDLRKNAIQTVKIYLGPAFDFDSSASKDYRSSYPKLLLIGDNPLKCDCEAYYFASYVSRTLPGVTHSWTIDQSNLVCDSPSSLAGTPLVSVLPDQFVCPCPGDYRPCGCKKRPSDKTVLFDCRGRNMTDIPPRLPANFPDHQMHLDLSSNPLTFDTADETPLSSLKSVTHLNLSRCNLTYSNLEAPGWLRQQTRFPNLQVLDLSANELNSVPKTVVSYWNASSNLSLLLSDNPYSCDCSMEDLFEFVIGSYTRVRDFRRMACQDGPFFSKMTLDDVCPSNDSVYMKATLAACALALIFMALFVLLYRYRRTTKAWLYNRGLCISLVAQEEDDDEDRLYDAFISFSHMDEDFVIQELVPQLETPGPGLPSYRLCLHYRDWYVLSVLQ